MNDERVREFLADSLKLWRVDGDVEPAEAPMVAVIRARDGASIRIERHAVHPSTAFPIRPEPVEGRTGNAQGERRSPPFRWIVHAGRARPCASIAGVLNALRSALGVERGEAVRVAAAVHPSTGSGRTGP